ncbi:MAG: SRPBCC family protein, partial [Chloroflexi bacterium]|nr:SRPBCC family protein [Chloroflexota bacterium]
HPGDNYAYTILRGLPFWTHRATFTLAPGVRNGQTEVVWAVRFEAAIPDRQLGPLTAHLEAAMADGLANLKRLIEQTQASPA